MKLRLAAPTLLVDLAPGAGPDRHRAPQRRLDDRRHDAARRDGARAAASGSPRRSRARSPTRRSATAARSAARSRTATRPPTSSRSCSRYEGSVIIRGDSAASARSRPPTCSRTTSRRRSADGEVLTEVRLPGARRLRVRLPEVQPPPGGLGDGGRLRAGQEGRRRLLRGRPHRAHPHGQRAAAGDRRRGGAARRGRSTPTAIAAAAEQAAEGTEPPGDLNASPDYKRHLARVLCRRALEEAAA